MWAAVWPFWWLAIFVSFGIWEGIALATGRMTLSAWMWTGSRKWPPLPFLVGLIVGFLACHFFWPNEGLP